MFFLKKSPVPWWEAIVDPWIRSSACIRYSMGGTPNPAVESNVIHTDGVVCDVTREVPTTHTRELGVTVGTLVWAVTIRIFQIEICLV